MAANTTIKLNPAALAATIDQARAATASNPRWLKAVEKAAAYLQAIGRIQMLDTSLVVHSARSNNTYIATASTCQCQAASHGNPCWHRAAALLVQRTRERQAWMCKYCFGPMTPGATIAGEPSLTCEFCGHEVMASVVAAACVAREEPTYAHA